MKKSTIMNGIMGIFCASVLGLSSYLIGHDHGRQEGKPEVIEETVDLNNDGVKDSIAYDIHSGQKTVYICRPEFDDYLEKDFYLKLMRGRLEGEKEAKVDKLKKIIEENLEKHGKR